MFVLKHIHRSCPVSEEFTGKFTTDPVCYSAHQIHHFSEPVLLFVYKNYESSPIKAVVDDSLVKLSPYTIPARNTWNKVHEDLAEFRQTHEGYIVEQTYETANKVITVTTDFINNVVIPHSAKVVHSIYQSSKIILRQIQLQMYINYNIIIRPSLIKLKIKFLESSLGERCLLAFHSHYIQSILYHIEAIYAKVAYALKYLVAKSKDTYESAMEFKDSDTYQKIQFKKKFLVDYMQYLPDFSKSETTSQSTTINVEPTNIPTSEKFNNLLKTTIESASKDFNLEIDQLNERFINKLHNEFQPALQQLSRDLTSGYDNLEKMIDNVNRFKSADHESHVSREIYRSAHRIKGEEVDAQIEEIKSKVDKFVESYLDEVLRVRVGILETLEEFADSTLNAYANEIIANGDDWEEWKKYKAIKKELVDFRDKLIIEKPNESFNKALNALKHEIYVLHNEAGSYLAILRAKANVEFQQREAEERENERKAKEEQRIVTPEQMGKKQEDIEGKADEGTKMEKEELRKQDKTKAQAALKKRAKEKEAARKADKARKAKLEYYNKKQEQEKDQHVEMAIDTSKFSKSIVRGDADKHTTSIVEIVDEARAAPSFKKDETKVIIS